MIACADMRSAIALLLLVGSACGSSTAPSVDATSTGEGTSTGSAAEETSSTGSPMASSSTSMSSSATTGPGDSSGAIPPDLPGPAPLQASEYCESIVDSFCDFYVRCGRMDVPSAEACHEPFLASCNTSFEPQYVALEEAGLLTLSEDGLMACEQHLADVACEQQVFELTGPCGEVWAGTQGAGESCGLDVEYFVCDPSAACTIGLDFCGTCETVREPGEDCTAEGTTCGPEGFCEAGTCRARVPNGDACTPDDRCMAGSACTDGVCEGPTFVERGDPCGPTQRCPYLTACVAGVCTTTAGLGEACSAATPCEVGFCDAGTCTAPRDNGEACAGNVECSSGLCVEDACTPRPSSCIAG